MDKNIDNSLDFSCKYINIASKKLGSRSVFATDDFFAPKERLLDHEDPVFIPGKYDIHGKWMDGWESRRKRGEGHDYCVVKLGVPSVVKGVDINTIHFTGNYPPSASLDACICGDDIPDHNTVWTELIPATNLQGDSHHFKAVTNDNDEAWTHLRLNIYPDGGVARLRVYGYPRIDWFKFQSGQIVDLSATLNGGRCVVWNNAHFGAPSNLLSPGPSLNMGDGWETRRRREPGADWVIIALGHPGEIRKILVDTAHFKGNYPDRCSIQAALVTSGTEQTLATQSMFWRTLLPPQKLEMDREHTFASEIVAIGPVSHVRFTIHPDGGVSRLRLFGSPTAPIQRTVP